MDLDAYVAEHAGEWRRLEQLSRRLRLSAAEADELVALYQRAATHLSVVRSRSPDPALLARLSRMVLQARSAVTGSRTFSWREVGRFFTTTFPVAVYRALPWWASVGAVFYLGSFLIGSYIAANPDVQYLFMSDEQIADLVERDFAAYYSEHQAQNFAFQVWVNNAWVAATCLATGILVLPVFMLVGNEIFRMGMISGIMVSHGKADVFFGLISPHGLLELTCVFVAAGVGLRMGWAWIAPPRGQSRGQSVAAAGRTGITVALGLVVVLAVCGFIEAFVTPSPLPTVVRVSIGVLALTSFLLYAVILGRRGLAAGATGDLDPTLAESTRPQT